MAKDDETQTERAPSVDPDRAAIISRRQHFVALALSGLATTACTDSKPATPDAGNKGDAKGQVAPQPCLEESLPEEAEDEGAPEQDSGEGPPPQACLKVAVPEEDTETGGTETGGTETGEDKAETGGEETKPKPAPKPCLRKVSPKPHPCLKQPPPQTCLNVVEVDDDDDL